MPAPLDPRQQELVQLNAERVRNAYSQYTMPPMRMGRQVLWYNTGDSSYGEGVLALVTKVTGNAISVSLQGENYAGMSIKEVPHASDPRLSLNSDCRENGCWDYAEEEGDQQVSIDRLTAEQKKILDRLQRMDGVASAQSRKIEALQVELADLRKWADQFGVDEEAVTPAGK